MAIHPHMAKIIAFYDLLIYRYYSPVWNRNAEGKLQPLEEEEEEEEKDGTDDDADDEKKRKEKDELDTGELERGKGVEKDDGFEDEEKDKEEEKDKLN